MKNESKQNETVETQAVKRLAEVLVFVARAMNEKRAQKTTKTSGQN